MWLSPCRIPRRHHHGHGPANPFHSHHQKSNGAKTGGSDVRDIPVGRRILEANARMADQLRAIFSENRVFVLNVMSSPGSGKTTLLEKTISRLMPKLRCAVIVGDISTTQDADRLAISGAPVIQINTDAFGGDCHLTAHAVKKEIDAFDLSALDLLIVENIGNLVCPAEFDLGEDQRVVVLSVTEGEDKPAKYPLMFRECNATILNKIDLLPYLEYDMARVRQSISHIHPGMPIFELSARTLAGFDAWIDWLVSVVNMKKNAVDS